MRQSLLCLRILFCLWDNLRNRFVWGQSLPCLHIFYVYETMATISRFSVLFEETHWKVYVIALSEDKRYHVYAHSSVYETVVIRRPRIFLCLKTMASMSKLTPMFENNRKHVHEHPQEFLQRGANPGASLLFKGWREYLSNVNTCGTPPLAVEFYTVENKLTTSLCQTLCMNSFMPKINETVKCLESFINVGYRYSL